MKLCIKKKSIDLKAVYYCFVFVLFLKPAILDLDIFSGIDTIFNILRFGLSILFTIIFFLDRQYCKEFFFPLGILCVAVLAGIIYGCDWKLVFRNLLPDIGFMAFLWIHRNNIAEIFEIIFRTGIFFLTINVITMFVYPNGIYYEAGAPFWILGQKQDLFACPIFISIIAWCVSNSKIKKSTSVLFWAEVFISCTKVISIGLTLSIGILVVLLYISNKYGRLLKAKLMCAVSLCLYGAMVCLTFIYDKLYLLRSILTSLPTDNAYATKEESFEFRVSMWRGVYKFLKGNFLIGTGRPSSSEWWQVTDGLAGKYDQVHSTFFEIMLLGGLLGVCIFVAWNIYNAKLLSRYQTYKLGRYMIAFCFVMNINGLVEVGTMKPCSMVALFMPCLFKYFVNSEEWLNVNNNFSI